MYSYDNIQSMYIAFGHVMLFDCQITNKMPKYTPKCEKNSIFWIDWRYDDVTTTSSYYSDVISS